MKHTSVWLPAYLCTRFKPRPSGRPVHVMCCFVDHYEPEWGGATLETRLARVERWVTEYPKLAGAHRDADGCPPRYTFFYPAEAYHPEVLERLSALCRAGLAEVELHLHHDADTSETLRTKLEEAKRAFVRHGLLSRERGTGAVRFGFIHGNWALDNARRDGKWCGVNDELRVLRASGCYADFTLPSAPSETQTRKINSLYYATDDPARPKSHDTGRDAAVGQPAEGDLLIVQGPLTLNWRRRKWGLFPRIENGELTGANPPTPDRADLWIRERIGVRGKPDWVFVKVFSHGAKPTNTDVMLGRPMDELFGYLESAYNDGTNFRLHYVTAREIYNLVRAAERGESGEPGRYRDGELVNPLEAP